MLIFIHAEEVAMDVLFIGITIVLFITSGFLVKLAERV